MKSSFRVLRTAAVTTLGAFLLTAGSISFAAPGDKAKDKNKGTAGKVKPLPPPSNTKMDALAMSQYIDKAVNHRLKEEGVSPSPLADDAEFLRRVYLDITGHIPSADKTVAFLDSKDPQKRAKLIDELLASPDYGNHLADGWERLMVPHITENRLLNHQPLISWLEENFNKNTPWSTMVHDLLTATGAQDKNGATTFLLANATVDKMTDEVCRLFLGVQLQCAQCHNHPFTEWKQTDYWGVAAFFMKVDVGNVQKAAKAGQSPELVERDGVRRNTKNALPESAKIVPPKFFLADQAKVPASGPIRKTLADWLTTAKNPYFSKAMTNRIWAQYFGRGLVNPIDDLQEGNAPSHPELLQELAFQFGANDFDLKYLVRAICNSSTYQRSSKPTQANAEAPGYLYSHMTVKIMTPEQLYDSLTVVLGKSESRGEGRKGGKGQPTTPRGAFVAFFGIDDGQPEPTEYQSGIPQVLNLMNSSKVNAGIQSSSLVRTKQPVAEAIDKVYLSTLSRRPTASEKELLRAHVAKEGDSVKGLSDILWAVLQSSEFIMNH